MNDTTNFDNIRKQFRRLGARVKVRKGRGARFDRGFHSRIIPSLSRDARWFQETVFAANIANDKKGEHFTFTLGDNSAVPKDERHTIRAVQVLDIQPKDRHLVLQVARSTDAGLEVDKLLMGHDERHWFVAGVDSKVTTVAQAKESLKPTHIAELQKRQGVRKKNRNKRHNRTFKRQGEWFFVRDYDFDEGKNSIIHRNEPISRGPGSKPHMCEKLMRVGGRTVMVNRRFAPNGISMDVYNKQIKVREDWRREFWQARTSGATVYVRGKVSHPDHKTLKLRGWHRVDGNAEPAMATVAFLD